LHDLDRIGDGQAALQHGRRLAEELGARRELPCTTGRWRRAASGPVSGTTRSPNARSAWSWPTSTACACTGPCSATASAP
jgi:hypothetical protein